MSTIELLAGEYRQALKEEDAARENLRAAMERTSSSKQVLCRALDGAAEEKKGVAK